MKRAAIVTMTAAGNANAARIAMSGAERSAGNGTTAMTEAMEMGMGMGMGMAEATTATIEPCWRIR